MFADAGPQCIHGHHDYFFSNARIDENALQDTNATAEIKSPAPAAKCWEAISTPSHKQMNACANESVCSGTYRHIPRQIPHKHNPLMMHARLNRISKVDPFSQADTRGEAFVHAIKNKRLLQFQMLPPLKFRQVAKYRLLKMSFAPKAR
jgi:hypothetical protein